MSDRYMQLFPGKPIMQLKLDVNRLCLYTFLSFGLLLMPQRLIASPLEIPYVPMEISTFPDDLKTFCTDEAYGIKDICGKLSHPSQLKAVDYMALKYIWGHENQLKEGTDEAPGKILKCIASKSKDPKAKCKDITQGMVAEGDPDYQLLNYLNGTDAIPELDGGEGDQKGPDLFANVIPSTNSTSKEAIPSLEEQFILGLAEFIVTRAKAEAAFYYQSELKDKLCNDNRDYFPNLCVALDALELSQSLNAMTGYLRSAIRKDIQSLPDVYLKNAAYRSCNKGDRELAEIFIASRLIYSAYAASKEGMATVDILRGISSMKLKCENAKGQLCDLASNPKEKNDLLTYLQTATIMLHAYEQNAYVVHTGETKPALRDFKDNLDKRYSIAGFALTLEYLMKKQQVPLIYDKKKLNPRPFKHLLTISDHVLEVMGRLEKIRELTEESKKPVILANSTKSYDPKLRLQERLWTLDSMLLLLDDLTAESYSLETYGKSDPQVAKKIHSNIAKIREASIVAQEWLRGDDAAYMVAFLSIVSEKSKVGDGNQLADDVKSVIPVMVEITSARTSQDVANVLEAAAAPVASYRQKDKRIMTSVTALFGAGFGGKEYYTLDGQRVEHSLGVQAFVPVGVHVSTPVNIFSWHTSLGGLVSLIELGPLVSTRNESGVQSQANVGFKQIFSPGIYFTMHIKGPFNIGYGVAKTPDLLKSTTGQDITEWRQQAFIAMDLTLLPF
jgi:hypothetical protein